MKLSLAWLCDHLPLNLDQLNVEQLVTTLNQTTAEVQNVRHVAIDQASLSLVRILEITSSSIQLADVATHKELALSYRDDLAVGDLALIVYDNQEARWAALHDLGGQRTEVLPALFLPEDRLPHWQSVLETHDYILEFDNTSINHRPDLWSHRGFAREVATILDIPLISQEELYGDIPVKQSDRASLASDKNLFSIAIQDSGACKRLAALCMNDLANEASHLFLASRLARIDARPIRSIVDLTNYIMFDMGQPLHAFDVAKIADNKLVAQRGVEGQRLELIDGSEVTLTSDDIVIADGKQPLALAGIMGGTYSAVSDKTTAIIVEAANFNADMIRKTSSRIKKRTEASARFEKKLDPNQNVPALKRFITLLRDLHLDGHLADTPISVGPESPPTRLRVAHETIERALGLIVPSDFVTHILSRLGFDISLIDNVYDITVPTFRAADITIKEDIVEEVGRFFLLRKLTFELPTRVMQPLDNRIVMRQREIKHLLARTLAMHEVYNYNLYDAQFLQKLSYEPERANALVNPVSEHWHHLVTSLIPHLIKNVTENQGKADELRFFEAARVWHHQYEQVSEHKRVSGIFWHKERLDFYEQKALLAQFFKGLSLEVRWVKETPDEPWWSLYQTAALLHNNNLFGHAGMAHPEFLSRVIPGQAFLFELDADYLLSVPPQEPRFVPLSKYQPVHLDISLFVPLAVTVYQIQQAIATADERIRNVELIDFYEKGEWRDKRSLTFRYVVQDDTKTLTKKDIEEVIQRVERKVQAQEGVVR